MIEGVILGVGVLLKEGEGVAVLEKEGDGVELGEGLGVLVGVTEEVGVGLVLGAVCNVNPEPDVAV